MDPGAIAALIQVGVAGVMLYLFVTGTLTTKKASDELVATVVRLYEARIKVGDDRLAEQKRSTTEWKGLALGTERRLDQVTPLVATALDRPVDSGAPPLEAGK